MREWAKVFFGMIFFCGFSYVCQKKVEVLLAYVKKVGVFLAYVKKKL